MHPTLNIAIKAARQAAKIINRHSLDIEKLKIEVKRQSDFVTEVDRAAEAAILDVLREAYPSHGILAEESGLAGTNPESEYQWITLKVAAAKLSIPICMLGQVWQAAAAGWRGRPARS